MEKKCQREGPECKKEDNDHKKYDCSGEGNRASLQMQAGMFRETKQGCYPIQIQCHGRIQHAERVPLWPHRESRSPKARCWWITWSSGHRKAIQKERVVPILHSNKGFKTIAGLYPFISVFVSCKPRIKFNSGMTSKVLLKDNRGKHSSRANKIPEEVQQQVRSP